MFKKQEIIIKDMVGNHQKIRETINSGRET